MKYLPAKKPGGTLIEQMLPDRWERFRLKMRFGFAAGFVLLIVLLCCWPWIHARLKVRSTRSAMRAVGEQIAAFTARTGHLPAHKPERLAAHLIMEMSFVGGDELTTFDPTQLNPTQIDPFSPAGGEAFVYFASEQGRKRWLLASAGPDGKYQIKIKDCVDYAQSGPASLAKIQYDPSNGTWSPGDMILTGP